MTARLLLLGLLVCFGCYGGDGSGDGGPSGPTDDQTGIQNPLEPADEAAIAEYARDVCAFYMRCLPIYRDLETCIELTSCTARGYFELAPITRGDLLSCSRSIAGIACDATSLPSNSSCMQLSTAIVGALDLETGCDGVTCDSASYCDESDPRCPRCAPRAALGASCLGVACVRETYCSQSSLRCEPELAEGMACEQDRACRRTGVLGAAGWKVCREGFCSAPAELGEPCEENSSDCALYLTCQDGVCSELKRAGEPCTNHGECLQGHSCVQGTCAQICGLKVQSIGEPCAFDLHCRDAFCDPDTSTCAALQAASMPCTSSEQCNAGLFCDPTSSTCAARAADGAECQLHDACISDFCNEQQCQQPTCN